MFGGLIRRDRQPLWRRLMPRMIVAKILLKALPPARTMFKRMVRGPGGYWLAETIREIYLPSIRTGLWFDTICPLVPKISGSFPRTRISLALTPDQPCGLLQPPN